MNLGVLAILLPVCAGLVVILAGQRRASFMDVNWLRRTGSACEIRLTHDNPLSMLEPDEFFGTDRQFEP